MSVILLAVIVHIIYAYTLKCPEAGHWNIRAKSHCIHVQQYVCLLSNDNYYTEQCTGERLATTGTKHTINRVNLDKKACSQERYQPFIFSTYGYSNCALHKSTCNDVGLVYHSNETFENDRTCRCDYTQRYAFMTPPKNTCYCIPSEEDCSCYLKRCSYKHILSPDYECVEETNIQYHSSLCLKTIITSFQPKKDDKLIAESNDIVGAIQNRVTLVIPLAVGIIVVFTIVVYVFRRRMESSNMMCRDIPGQTRTTMIGIAEPTNSKDDIAPKTKVQENDTNISPEINQSNYSIGEDGDNDDDKTNVFTNEVTHGNDSSDEEHYQDYIENNDSKNEVTHGNDSSDEENYQDCSETNDSKNATFIENIKTTKDANQTTPPETDAESVAPGIHHIDLDVQVDQKDHLPKTVDEKRTTPTSANCASDLSEDKEIATIAPGNIHPKPSKDDRKLSETLEFQHTIDANNATVTAEPVHILGHDNIDLDVQVDKKEHVPKTVDEERSTPTCANCASNLSEDKEIATIATGNIQPKPSKDDRKLSKTLEFQHTIHANNASVTAQPVHIIGHNKQLSSTITDTPKREVDVDISAESLMTENAEISNTANNITQQQHKEADSAQPVSPLAYVVPSEPTISCTVQPSPVCAENVVVRSQHPLTGSKQGQYTATYEDDSQNGSTLRDFELHVTDHVVNTTATVPIDKALEDEATPDDNCCIVAAEKKYLKEVNTTSFAEAIQTVPENAQSATLPGSTDCTKQNLTAHKQMHDADVSDFQIMLDEIDTTDGKSEESKEIE